MHPRGGLVQYYRDNVAGGPSSFVTEVHDFLTIGRTMILKLVSEISVNGVQTRFAMHRNP
jgi:hypothetical protein